MAYTLADAYLMRLRVDPTQLRKDVDRATVAGGGLATSGRKAGTAYAAGMRKSLSGLRTVFAGLGVVGVATGLGSAVRAADALETSTLHLREAVSRSSTTWKAYEPVVARSQATMAHLGFSSADTADALNKLIRFTGGTVTGTRALGVAANVAAARNVDLGSAVDLVKTGIIGTQRTLRQFNITVATGGSQAAAMTKAHAALSDQIKMSGGMAGFARARNMDLAKAQRLVAAAAGQAQAALKDETAHGLTASSAAALLAAATSGAAGASKNLAKHNITLSALQRDVTASTGGSVKAFNQLGIEVLPTTATSAMRAGQFLDIMGRKLSGSALARVHTFGGQMAILRAETTDLAAKGAMVVLPYLTKLLGAFTGTTPKAEMLRKVLVGIGLALGGWAAAAATIKTIGALRSGWGTLQKVLGWITGGKVGVGMQSAGDTMLVASGNMQRAADTMVSAGWTKGWPTAAGKGAPVPLPAAGGGVVARFTPFIRPLVASVVAVMAGGALAAALLPKPDASERARVDAAMKGLPGAIASLLLGSRGNAVTITAWLDTHLSQPIQRALGLLKPAKPQTRPPTPGGGTFTDPRTGLPRSLANPWAARGTYTDPKTGLPRSLAPAAVVGGLGATSMEAMRRLFHGTATAADAARVSVRNYTTAVSQLGTLDTRTQAARAKLVADLERSGMTARTAQRDVNRLSTAVALHGAKSDQARAARRRLIGDLEQAFADSRTGRRDMTRLADAIRDHGAKSDAARGARRKLIQDLIGAGVDANTARSMVRKMIAAIADIRGKHVSITVSGAGHFTIAQVKSLSRPGGKLSGPLGAARGLYITAGTTPTADDVLARVSKRELIVPANIVDAGEVDHLRGRIPGFAKGGVPAGDKYAGSVYPGLGKWTQREVDAYQAQFVTATGRAMQAAMRGAMSAAVKQLVLSGGSNAIVRDAMQWIGKIPYVWGGTSVPGGADCSGFVQTIYGRHGIMAPRTSEAQGGWVRRSNPVPGGLALYNSPAGGAPPGHVAIVGDRGMVISQGGGMGPQYVPLRSMPLMFTGVPPGGFAAPRRPQTPGQKRRFGGGGWIGEPVQGVGLRTAAPYQFHAGEQVSTSGRLEKHLAAVVGRLDDLIAVARRAPGRTGAGVAVALDRGTRRAAYSGNYGG